MAYVEKRVLNVKGTEIPYLVGFVYIDFEGEYRKAVKKWLT